MFSCEQWQKNSGVEMLRELQDWGMGRIVGKRGIQTLRKNMHVSATGKIKLLNGKFKSY